MNHSDKNGELDRCLAQKCGLLGIAVEQRHLQLGTRDGQRDSRHAAATSDVEQIAGRNERENRQRIEQVMADCLFFLA